VLIILGAISPRGLGHAQDPDWKPPEPHPDAHDWILLNSGEWLRGEIHLISDEVMEFESKELDELTLDLEDVREIRSPRILTYTFENGTSYVGQAVMDKEKILIRGAEGEREFRRADLLTVIEGKPIEWNYWSMKLTIGLIGRSGNTNQDDFNANALIRRQSKRHRVDLSYLGNFSQLNDEQTVNNHNVSLLWNYLISKGVFVNPFYGRLYEDKFQNIALRSSISAGLGYYLIRKKSTGWYIVLGWGYVNSEFVSVEEGEPSNEESGMIIPSTSLEMDITSDLELTFSYDAQITLPDTGGTIHHAFAELGYELTSILELDFSLTWDRVENPTTTEDGIVPERDDLRTYIGIGFNW